MKTLTVDGCSICQLKCVQCPVSQMGYKDTIGKGYLHYPDFCALLNRNPHIKHVEFDNFGEFFLNPDLSKILEEGHKRNIMMSSAGGVNLNTATDLVLEDLVRYRFQYLNVSIDGTSQETYGQYRKGGKFQEVIDHLTTINKYKQMYRTPYPKLQWQFIVFGHNEHELPEAEEMAKRFGMRFWPKMNWNSEYSPIKDIEFVKQQTGWEVTTREEYEDKYGVSYVRPTCYQLWSSPRLSWDVSLTGCCWNLWRRFTPETLEYAKNVLTGSYPVNQLIPCNNCEIYRGLNKSGLWLSHWETMMHTVKSRWATNAKYLLWRSNQ